MLGSVCFDGASTRDGDITRARDGDITGARDSYLSFLLVVEVAKVETSSGGCKQGKKGARALCVRNEIQATKRVALSKIEIIEGKARASTRVEVVSAREQAGMCVDMLNRGISGCEPKTKQGLP